MTSDKLALRTDILSRRRALTAAALAEAAERIAAHLSDVARGARRITAYVPVGTEPGSVDLLDALRATGAEVLLPVLLPDGDLEWARYDGAAALADAGRGLREPTGRRLGRDAIRPADVVLVPALAVDRAGHRLGRGGGSYDRALTRVGDRVPVVALLHDGELVDCLPVQPHDRPVTHVVMPATGCRRVGDR